jgi:hypothetical protein
LSGPPEHFFAHISDFQNPRRHRHVKLKALHIPVESHFACNICRRSVLYTNFSNQIRDPNSPQIDANIREAKSEAFLRPEIMPGFAAEIVSGFY